MDIDSYLPLFYFIYIFFLPYFVSLRRDKSEGKEDNNKKKKKQVKQNNNERK